MNRLVKLALSVGETLVHEDGDPLQAQRCCALEKEGVERHSKRQRPLVDSIGARRDNALLNTWTLIDTYE